jgi:Flp pilus assembly protein TadG
MMRFLKSWLGDREGLAAIEFALVVPVLATLLVFGVDGWMRVSQVSDARTALQTGARYYETGGGSDTAAQAAAVAAWRSKPADGALNIARSCVCGSNPADCASICTADSSLPLVFVQLTAQGTYPGLIQSHPVNETNVIRIR